MVKAGDMDLYKLTDTQRPPVHHEKKYTDTICLTKAPEFNNPTRYFRTTYDFSSPRRFKTVVYLEPTLAPVRYHRVINYGIPAELRHKSTVDCDFRPRAKNYSETTWIFPKQGKDVYTSTFERNQLVDTTWYRSKVSVASGDCLENGVNGVSESEEKITPACTSSSSEDEDVPTNNNCTKLPCKAGDKISAFSNGLDPDIGSVQC